MKDIRYKIGEDAYPIMIARKNPNSSDYLYVILFTLVLLFSLLYFFNSAPQYKAVETTYAVTQDGQLIKIK